MAGALLAPEPFESGGERKFLGSGFVVEAPTYKEVKDKMENDIYWKENVVRPAGLFSSFAQSSHSPPLM